MVLEMVLLNYPVGILPKYNGIILYALFAARLALAKVWKEETFPRAKYLLEKAKKKKITVFYVAYKKSLRRRKLEL